MTVSPTLRAGHPGQGVRIAMFPPRAMFNGKIVLLEALQPPSQLAFGLFKIPEPGQRPMVSSEGEVASKEVGVEMANESHRCQKLTATVIASGPITKTRTNATGSSRSARRGRALRGTGLAASAGVAVRKGYVGPTPPGAASGARGSRNLPVRLTPP